MLFLYHLLNEMFAAGISHMRLERNGFTAQYNVLIIDVESALVAIRFSGSDKTFLIFHTMKLQIQNILMP